jgi:hypothetical protein
MRRTASDSIVFQPPDILCRRQGFGVCNALSLVDLTPLKAPDVMLVSRLSEPFRYPTISRGVNILDWYGDLSQNLILPRLLYLVPHASRPWLTA